MADKKQADLFRSNALVQSTVPLASQSLSDLQRHDWLRLYRTKRIGSITFRELLNHFGSAARAIEAIEDGGFASKRITLADPDDISRELEKARKFGARIVALGEPQYPRWLQAVEGAPPLLYVKGRVELSLRPAIAMVGSRNASGAGLKIAYQLSSELGQYGFVMASGLARGIDHGVHQGAINSGTIAVLGGGLDHIYPAQNEETYHAIAQDGLLISERPLGFYAQAKNFPRRNRIISGISLATVVIEAALRSGSLTTARFAGEQGREVFAIPGHPLDPRAAGTNKLIQDGASLMTSSRDIIAALEGQLDFKKSGFEDYSSADISTPLDAPSDDREQIGVADNVSNLNDVDHSYLKDRLVELMGPTPMEKDSLVRLLKCNSRDLQIVLLELDLEGRIEHHGQQRISLLTD